MIDGVLNAFANLDLSGVSVVEAVECWRLWPTVASLVLNFLIEAGSVHGIRSAGLIEGVSRVSVKAPRAC